MTFDLVQHVAFEQAYQNYNPQLVNLPISQKRRLNVKNLTALFKMLRQVIRNTLNSSHGIHELHTATAIVLLVHIDPSLPEGIYAGLSADTLDLNTRAATHLLSYRHEIDPSGPIHPPGVNLQDVHSGLHIWRRELDLPVNPARP